MERQRAIILEYRYDNPWMNLAYETCLMNLAARDAKKHIDTFVLATWQNDNTIVVGRNQNALAEFDLEKTKRDGVRIARRPTGGGAVYHDMGNMNFTFISPRNHYDSAATAKIIMDAVGSFGVEVAFAGRNDIMAEGRKFSGNAYTMNEWVGLHHGTLLISADLSKIGEYLTPDKLKHTKNSVASIPSPVVALSALNPEITVGSLRNRVETSFRETLEAQYPGIAFEKLEDNEIPEEELRMTFDLYSSEEWVLGSHKGAPHCTGKFRWGKVSLHFHLGGGQVQGVDIVTDSMLLNIWEEVAGALKGCSADGEALRIRLEELRGKRDNLDEREVLSDLGGMVAQSASFGLAGH